MKKLMSVLMITAMLGLGGCATTSFQPMVAALTQTQYKNELPDLLLKAENGDAMMQVRLSYRLARGWGTVDGQPDMEGSMKWLQRAVDQNSMGAMAALAGRYAYGMYGVAKDEIKAREINEKVLKAYELTNGLSFALWERRELATTITTLGYFSSSEHNDTNAAVAGYCLALKINPAQEQAKHNLQALSRKCQA